MIIEILAKLKIRNFFLSFTMPTLIDAICKDFKLSKKDLEFIKERFRNKNIYGIKKFLEPWKMLLQSCNLVLGVSEKILKTLKHLNFQNLLKLRLIILL